MANLADIAKHQLLSQYLLAFWSLILYVSLHHCEMRKKLLIFHFQALLHFSTLQLLEQALWHFAEKLDFLVHQGKLQFFHLHLIKLHDRDGLIQLNPRESFQLTLEDYSLCNDYFLNCSWNIINCNI